MPDFCSLIERLNFISFAFQIPLPSSPDTSALSCCLDTFESIKMLPHHHIYRHGNFVHADQTQRSSQLLVKQSRHTQSNQCQSMLASLDRQGQILIKNENRYFCTKTKMPIFCSLSLFYFSNFLHLLWCVCVMIASIIQVRGTLEGVASLFYHVNLGLELSHQVQQQVPLQAEPP